jgi:hypothetical protein
MHVIGAGLGRTGTYSLKLAINRLGLGPCHHMEAVIQDMPGQVPLWAAAPPDRKAWMEMAYGVIARSGFPAGLAREDIIKAFIAHNQAVKATIPQERLLVWQVREGWGPLCAFLDVAVPDEPFPRSNDRAEFIARVKAHMQS